MTDLPDRLSQRPAPVVEAGMLDVLSDVLHTVRLTGSMLFLVEATAPFMSQAPATRAFAAGVLPAAQHLSSYHVLTEGRCWAGLTGQPPQPAQAGDILVVPHGDPYFLAAPADAPQSYSDDDAIAFFRRMAAGELPTVVNEGGGGETTRFICGFLGCDALPFNPVLAALPRVIHLRGAARHGERMSHLVAFALDVLRRPDAGSREVLLRLSELMFVEVVRSQLAGAAGAPPGWLAGLLDPLVARALARLHSKPAQAWTLASLAASASTSRSTLAEHFAHHVGQTPMQYLSAWRMQLASRMLADGGAKVRAVAEAVGYDSEAAFSRAFKKHTGLSPSDWRRR
jgi:AraC-like DNA-binding protein